MSAKNSKKKNPGKKGIPVALWAVIGVVIAALIAVLLLRGLRPDEPHDGTSDPAQTDSRPQNTVSFEAVEKISVDLGYGLSITDVGKYTGIYMEDGTDELVSGILMIVVTNSGEDAIQYAEITMPVRGGQANFSLSTLPAGESAVLLEKSRLQWSGDEDYANATLENTVLFTEPLSLCQDRLKLQILDGAINVTNISGADITGDIMIYYKNSAADLYYGGITYRVRMEGGIKAGEIKQIMASHFSTSGSSIMFVTVGG